MGEVETSESRSWALGINFRPLWFNFRHLRVDFRPTRVALWPLEADFGPQGVNFALWESIFDSESIHKTKLDLSFVSLRSPFFYFILFENDFHVPVVHEFSNVPCTLFICVRSWNMMHFFFFRPLQRKTRIPNSLKSLNSFYRKIDCILAFLSQNQMRSIL